MSFGVFESACGSEVEVGLAKQASIDNFAAAVYDVREKLGPVLFASRDVEEFRHKVAMMKSDQSVYKIIEAHTFPLPKVIRRIVGKNSVLENEFRQRLATPPGSPLPGPGGGLGPLGGSSLDAIHPPGTTNGIPPQSPTPSDNSSAPGARPGHDAYGGPDWGGNHGNYASRRVAAPPGAPLPGPGGGPGPTLNDNFDRNPSSTPASGDTSSGNFTPPNPSGNTLNTTPPGVSGGTSAGTNNPYTGARIACWPGCHENEAHAAKFHSRDKKESSFQRIAEPPRTPTDPPDAPNPQGAYQLGPNRDIPGSDFNFVQHEGASRRYYADFEDVQDIDDTFEDHQGEVLKPKGDFKGYLKKMDQGAPQKVKRNFASRQRAAHYLRWCQAANLSPIRLSTLDHYAQNLDTAEYFRLANTITAWENNHKPRVPSTKLKKKDKVALRRTADPDGPDPGDVLVGGPSLGTGGTLGVPGMGGIGLGTGAAAGVTGGGGSSDPNLGKGMGPGARPASRQPRYLAKDPMTSYRSWCRRHGLRLISARNIDRYAAHDPQLAYFLAMRCKEAIKVAYRRYADDSTTIPKVPGSTSNPLNPNSQGGFLPGYQGPGGAAHAEPTPIPGPVQGPLPGYKGGSRRRIAAPDYLQKADDALTQLLNQKAEEFQQTIAPLQQALITVQQAEQLQQQQNPLNVLPPPGTVNVMPGQPNSTPGQLGMPDPNQPDISALVQALQPGGGGMGGVAPQGDAPMGGDGGAGAPPPAATGGGLPPDLDQSAQKAARRRQAGNPHPHGSPAWFRWESGEGDPASYGPHGSGAPGGGIPLRGPLSPEQEAWMNKGRPQKRGGSGKGRGPIRPRQAAGVGELWDRWKSRRADEGDALRGGDVDYERFQNEHGVGDRALQNLKQRNEKPDFAPVNGQVRGRAPQGITVGRRRQAQGTDDFYTYNDRGQSSDHPGRSRGWKGQFAQEQPGPHDGEFYTKGRANVRGGPGPQESKYWLTTPHGMSGPYPHPHHAFDAAEPFLAQDAEIGGGQGELFAPPRAKGAARQRRPLGRGRQGAGGQQPVPVPGLDDQLPGFGGQTNFGQGTNKVPPGIGTGPDGGRHYENNPPPMQRQMSRQRKQAWTGWGPAMFPKTRKVAGWDWDDHLNGYLASKPQHFACECGDSFPTPSGFQRCACGRQWNSYVIGTGGSNREASAEKFIVREVPVRPDIIVANRKLALRKGAPFAGYEDFEDCESKNSDKDRPDAYCGEIKHRTEDKKKAYRRAYGPPKSQVQPRQRPGIPHGVEAVEYYRNPRGEEAADRIVDDRGNHWAALKLVDPRTGTIHNLIDPGELDDGEDPKHPTFRKQPKDWARRSGDGKWTPSAIG